MAIPDIKKRIGSIPLAKDCLFIAILKRACGRIHPFEKVDGHPRTLLFALHPQLLCTNAIVNALD
jgi:hypothetical protein